MAQKTVVTTPDVAANSGQGTPLATAFEWINDNFDEVYGKPDLSLVTNTLTLTKADGTTDTVDLAPYLDDTAIVSASIDGAGIATFVNSDTSSFTLDLSSLDTNLITSVDGGTGLEVDTTTGDVTIGGDLTVDGTTTTINSTNLLVADKFALFASGSTSATDGGFIIQSDVNGDGRAFGYDASSDRWALQTALNSTGSSFTGIDAFINTVETSTSAPSAAPVYGGTSGHGAMHVNTNSGDVFIYA